MELKNDGEVTWPIGFKVKPICTPDDSISVQLNEISIQPSETIMLDIFIRNPKQVGNYYYLFNLMDINGRKFGSEFSFSFNVKNNNAFFGGLGNLGDNGRLYQSCAY